MHTTITGQSHQVQLLVVLLGVGVSSLYLRILHDRAVLAGTVDLNEVLIHDASSTDIQVTHLRVTHLSVGQTNVLTRGLKRRVS